MIYKNIFDIEIFMEQLNKTTELIGSLQSGNIDKF